MYVYLWLIHVDVWQKPGFPGGSDGRESTYNAGDPGSLGQGDPPGGRNSCLENSTVRGAWRAAVHGVSKSRT